MKIKIITNTFDDYKRQNIAVDSWRYLRDNYKGIVELVNLQFEDEKDTFQNPYPDIPVKFVLSDSRKKVIGAEKKLPFMNEVFNAGLAEDCDGFIYTNSDVIITHVLINKIINTNPRAIACSRLDIEDIDHFNRILAKDVKPVRWEIAGIDTVYINKQWGEEHKKYFQAEFLMGKFLWDVYWGGVIKIFGDATPIENGYPVSCFHLHHGIAAVTAPCAERSWNLKIAKSDPLITLLINAFSFNTMQNFTRRTPYGAFLNIPEEEKKIESVFFSYMSINRDLT